MDLSSFFDISQFRSVELTEYRPLSITEVWTPTPYHKNVELVGYGGLGIYLPNLAFLWPSVLFAIAFYTFRLSFKRIRVAKRLGINAKDAEKMMYQVWLLIFYIVSSIYGIMIMYGKPWCSFPLGPSQKVHQLINHPQVDSQIELQYYYCCAIGFYAAELIAIFSESKRSDFREYLIHHSVTLYLLIFSWLGFEQVPGAYTILLHDLSDIFLCVSKITHYAKVKSSITNVTFTLFVLGFVFFRLYCLPHQTTMFLTLLPTIQYASVNFWVMIAFLQVLQCLHFFWGYLILKMIIRLTAGGAGDVRSDDESDEKK
eukprot:GILI01005216.1.p1 GENE.GILI01005216.1~~GILI01005216.1.p1  ORF type:complete len:314 (-),score=58.51 GILI01005216.1:407-1348(-)